MMREKDPQLQSSVKGVEARTVPAPGSVSMLA